MPAYRFWGISIHALREEGDLHPIFAALVPQEFLSTPSARRATSPVADTDRSTVFLSTPSARRATFELGAQKVPMAFLSTPSARRATCGHRDLGELRGDFYPRPPRGGRLYSARAPRTSRHFYPRPPRGGRHVINNAFFKMLKFLSTPSARRATTAPWNLLNSRPGFLSTPSARRATGKRRGRRQRQSISIHALREEGDLMTASSRRRAWYFYPRPPRGGRREEVEAGSQSYEISIHALREEGDLRCAESAEAQTDFYPRPPRGGRRRAYRNVG